MNPSHASSRSNSSSADASTIYRTRRDPEVSATVSVVRAVAEVEDETPEALPVLWETIDPEALDNMFEDVESDGQSNVRVSFDYCGYIVTVTEDVVTLDI